jgi:hypothetical protein
MEYGGSKLCLRGAVNCTVTVNTPNYRLVDQTRSSDEALTCFLDSFDSLALLS